MVDNLEAGGEIMGVTILGGARQAGAPHKGRQNQNQVSLGLLLVFMWEKPTSTTCFVRMCGRMFVKTFS